MKPEIEMTTDGISSQVCGATYFQPSAEQQAFRSNVKSLIDAIKSGDLDAAKEAFAKIEDTTAHKTETNSDSPFAQLIAQLGEALQANDIDGAKDALSAFHANRPSGPPPGGGPRPGGPSEAERSAFGQLVSALKTDDLDGAKEAYANLLDARESSAPSSDSSKTSPIDSFLSEIGAALNDNDLETAQSVLSQLAHHRSHGGAVDVST
jgi:hypothetical protein